MFLEVLDAKFMGDYKISLVFNMGESTIVDLSRELIGKIFEPLKDLGFFQLFTIKYNTIEWSNGADFAPEFLLELGNKQEINNSERSITTI